MTRRAGWVRMLGTGALLAALSTGSGTLRAQEGEPLALEDIAVMLGSSDPEEVREAIEATAVLGEPAAVQLLQQRVEEGLPPDLLGLALDSLGLMHARGSADLLRELTFHRRTEIRVRALQGLAALGRKQATPHLDVVQRRLGDSDPRVRAAAAAALGRLEVRAALPQLFEAFELGVPESGAAIAQLAGSEELERITGYLGRFPFENVEPIVLGLLRREDWKESAKLRVVTELAEVATADAKRALEQVAEMDSRSVSPKVRRAAAEAAERIAN